MSTPLYDRHYHRLEKVRWDMADIPFDTIDRTVVAPETLDFVRVNCLMELSALYATRMFLRDFRDNPDFCQFMSIWYFEEMRHYLVLREYLKPFGMEPAHGDLDQYDTELSPAPWPNTLAMHWCGELRLGRWYLNFAEAAEEPVLAQIFRLIAEDEFRHAQCYEDFMHQALEQDPTLIAPFANTAKWMLVNPQGDKHPTTYREGSADGRAVIDNIGGYHTFLERVQEMVPEDVEIGLEKRVLKTVSRLAGVTLESRGDLVRFTLGLQSSPPTTIPEAR